MHFHLPTDTCSNTTIAALTSAAMDIGTAALDIDAAVATAQADLFLLTGSTVDYSVLLATGTTPVTMTSSVMTTVSSRSARLRRFRGSFKF